MLLLGRKLEQQTLVSLGGGTKVINRLHVSDRTSKSKYLINSGADVSVVPLSAASKHRPLASLQLLAANRISISTYSQHLLTLDLRL
ncbi:hypothetical protein NPIL_641201 [Nephila pilipes]|uniref:Peptidase A2 domain-containing protein n=1 Tax=Nephila pilipes TaxID=299642 RepID=A0A8X6QRW5_NEPPI|nr:hypothetical protein NPIL_641201 [Nephila pilipes]